jgi:hypothetical protein
MRFFQLLLPVTALALGYIHLQMQIINLAYQAKQKENELTRISEFNGMIAYDILRLKSTNHLGDTLLADNPELKFRNNEQVIQLVTVAQTEQVKNIEKERQGFSSWLKLIMPRAPAEAQAEEKKEIFGFRKTRLNP